MDGADGDAGGVMRDVRREARVTVNGEITDRVFRAWGKRARGWSTRRGDEREFR